MFSHPESAFCLGLEIAGISMTLSSDQKWEDEAAFLPFMKRREDPDYRVTFREVASLPEFPDSVIHADECYRVHPDGKGGYLRSFFDAPRDLTPYALARYDHAGGSVRIDYLAKGAHCVSQLHNSFFHLGFEAMLAHRDRLCLHAACVDTPLGGILFSGPSGIGKSTQADLWHRCRGGKHINGDRPILSREAGKWYAWGSPYAGSSKCHVNARTPVTAIVMLQQEKTCSIRKLDQAEAFRAVWSGLTVPGWDKTIVERSFDLAADLIAAVPVYRFGCTPDVAAVEFLEKQLRKEFCL